LSRSLAPSASEGEGAGQGGDFPDAVLTLLTSARRPLLYLGAGAAAADLVALAEKLQSPVSTTFSGKGVFPESHPLWLWCGFGQCAPPWVRKIADRCDLTLAIGCRFSEVGTGSWGLQPPGKLIHVDADPAALNRNFPAEVPIVSDAAAFVSALLPALPARQPDPALRQAIADGHAQVWKEWCSGGIHSAAAGRVSPPRLFRALQAALGPGAVYTTDSGNGTFLAMECLRLDHPASFLAPVDYSCMGYAVPAALGAALACPERPVAALAGDGAFLMTGLELLTAAQLALPVMVLVLRDRELGQIAQFQQTVFARKTCSRLPDYDLPALCRGVGVEHLALNRNADLEPVLQQARSVTQQRRPVVVEVAIDYSQPTWFTRGVVRTNFSRLPWRDRLRFLARALQRRVLPT
jgi:acetolactate synthase-1/2/3 large subunit